MNFNDEQLVKLYLKNSDEKALESLVKRYLPLIYGFVRKYTGDRDNASDITQETFVKVWRNLGQFNQSKSFRTWIFTIAKNAAIDWLKKKNALPFSVIQAEQEGSNDFVDSLTDGSPSISEQLSTKENSRKLAKAAAHLPIDYATVIKLHISDELNFREIAEFLEEPLNTIKSRYRRGISLLRNILLEDSTEKD